jgi:hypothetical protein
MADKYTMGDNDTAAPPARTGKNGRPVLMDKVSVRRRLYMRRWRAACREWEWANGPRPRYDAPGRPA